MKRLLVRSTRTCARWLTQMHDACVVVKKTVAEPCWLCACVRVCLHACKRVSPSFPLTSASSNTCLRHVFVHFIACPSLLLLDKIDASPLDELAVPCLIVAACVCMSVFHVRTTCMLGMNVSLPMQSTVGKRTPFSQRWRYVRQRRLVPIARHRHGPPLRLPSHTGSSL